MPFNTSFYKTRSFLTFLVTAVCFLFTYYYYHFYYVEYEALFDSFYSGRLTEGMPFGSIYFLGNIGLSHLYSWLYQLNPGIEWISWILYSYLFISCFICLYLVSYALGMSVSVWTGILIQLAIYFLVFADHNIHFIFTRVSYMATGFSLIGLVFFFKQPGSIRSRPWLFAALNVWFIVGTLTRSESATAAFLQVSFFGLLYLQNIKRFTLLFLFPALFLLSVLSAITYDIKTSHEFYKQVEPDIEAQLLDRENAKPLSDMRTYRDSAMWGAAIDVMWSDPRVMSPAYLRSLIQPEGLIYTDSQQWQRVYRSLSQIAIKFWYLASICLLLGIILFFSRVASSRTGFIYFAAFVISFWVLISLQTYTVKINDRSFSPLISLFIFCHIMLLLPMLKKGMPRIVYIALAGIAGLFLIHIHALGGEAAQLQKDLRDYRKNREVITKAATGKILVLNSSSCDYLLSANVPFHPFDFSAFKKIYITDGYNMPFLPYYRRYLERECRCDMYDFPGFWDYLRGRHDQVVIVSTPRRMEVLTRYMAAVHQYELPISEQKDATLLDLKKSDQELFNVLKIYSLGK